MMTWFGKWLTNFSGLMIHEAGGESNPPPQLASGDSTTSSTMLHPSRSDHTRDRNLPQWNILNDPSRQDRPQSLRCVSGWPGMGHSRRLWPPGRRDVSGCGPGAGPGVCQRAAIAVSLDAHPGCTLGDGDRIGRHDELRSFAWLRPIRHARQLCLWVPDAVPARLGVGDLRRCPDRAHARAQHRCKPASGSA